MSNTTRNKSAGMLGLALAGLVMSGSSFAMQPLAQGYMVAAQHAAQEAHDRGQDARSAVAERHRLTQRGERLRTGDAVDG